MKNPAMRTLAGALALLLGGAAPLAAHGGHAEAGGGALHLVLHLPGSPWAWAAAAGAAAVGILVGRLPRVSGVPTERRER